MALSPDDFWSLSPREWGWLIAAGDGAAPALSRAGLAGLINLYPDEKS